MTAISSQRHAEALTALLGPGDQSSRIRDIAADAPHAEAVIAALTSVARDLLGTIAQITGRRPELTFSPTPEAVELDTNGRCRSCHAPIAWRITDNGRRIPLDPAPILGGNVIHTGLDHTDHNGRATPIVAVLDAQTARRREQLGHLAHRSHFATCPNANTHRHAR